MESAPQNRAIALLGTGAIALIAAVALAVVTSRWGLGVTPDSVTYLRMARGFLGHESGLPADFSVHPPLYPAVLAGLSALTGVEPFAVARWLAVFLFAGNVTLVGFLGLRLAGSASLAALGAALVAASDVMWLVHSHLWTEPLFLLLALLALYLLGSEGPERSGWRYWSGAVCLSLACLTRYAGIAVILAAALGLWLSGAERLGRRLLRVLIVVLIAAVPMLVWGARAAGFAGRGLVWHPVHATQVNYGLAKLAMWVFPERFALPLLGAPFAAFGAGLLAWALVADESWSVRLGDAGRYRILRPLVALLLVYPAFLTAAISIYDASLDMGPRLLGAPLFPVAAVAFTTLAAALLRGRSRALRAAAMVCCLLLVVMYLRRTAPHAAATWREGQRYSGRVWRESPVIEFARHLDGRVQVYTNLVGPVWFLTGREATLLPRMYNPQTLRINANFEDECTRLARALQTGRAVLIYFRKDERWYLPTEQELVRRLRLEPLVEFPDGVVYERSGDRAGVSTWSFPGGGE